MVTAVSNRTSITTEGTYTASAQPQIGRIYFAIRHRSKDEQTSVNAVQAVAAAVRKHLQAGSGGFIETELMDESHSEALRPFEEVMDKVALYISRLSVEKHDMSNSHNTWGISENSLRCNCRACMAAGWDDIPSASTKQEEPPSDIEYICEITGQVIFCSLARLQDFSSGMEVHKCFGISHVEWSLTGTAYETLVKDARRGAMRDALQQAEEYASAFTDSKPVPTEISKGRVAGTAAEAARQNHVAFAASNWADTHTRNTKGGDGAIRPVPIKLHAIVTATCKVAVPKKKDSAARGEESPHLPVAPSA